jgi:hypothetical protein
VQEGATSGTALNSFASYTAGLSYFGEGTSSFVTTGESSSPTGATFGPCVVRRLAPGTYTVSVQYRATSGSVAAKERLLQVEVHGF